MTAAAARPHTDAVVSAYEAAGLLVGRGVQPAGSGWQGEPGQTPHVPYLVLYPTAGHSDGDLADPNEYLDYTWQVTAVGDTQPQAEDTMDTARTLVGVRLAVPGRSAYPVYPLLERPAVRDDGALPPVHYAVAQFRFRTQPA